MTKIDKLAGSGRKNIWNHQGTVVFSPLFDWPPRSVDAFLALTKRWVTINRNVLFLLMAVCVYNYFLPEMTEMTEMSALSLQSTTAP